MTTILQDVVDTAKRAVETFHDRSSGRLNFSENNLSIVEEMLAEASGYIDEMSQSEISCLVKLFGCYVLEVGRTRYGDDGQVRTGQGPLLCRPTNKETSPRRQIRGVNEGNTQTEFRLYLGGRRPRAILL